jgi:hypothetical protein
MSAKERIASLENKLMEIGYTPSLETMPGYVNPFLVKGEIGVHLEEPVTIDHDADKCVMQIHMPFRNSESRRSLIYGYGLLFTTHECGGKWWYVRNFPYAEVTTCLAGRKDLSDYMLPISDEQAAIETIEREVEFTRRMLGDSDMQTMLESPPLNIPTESPSKD